MLIPTQPIASTSLHHFPALSSTSKPTPGYATSPKPSRSILLNGLLTPIDTLPTSGGRVKKFVCTFEGCGKAYTRPTRLAEHERSHTGERPFQCPHCSVSFIRESHLKAHLRTHSTNAEEEKSHPCPEKGCNKKFWTNQHVKKHVEVVHRGKTYDCAECGLKFRKHNVLRTHVIEAHSEPGTLPFPCTAEGCSRSFGQLVHLKAHLKTHDPTRYQCAHPSCLLLPIPDRQFPTWTALQKHTKSEHRPRCPHPECDGKTFTSQRGLRGHLDSKAHNPLKQGGGGEGGTSRNRKRSGGRRKRNDSTDEESEAEETENESEEDESSAEESDEDDDEEGREERMDVEFARVKRVQKAKDEGTSTKRRRLSVHTRSQAAGATPLLDLLTGSNYATPFAPKASDSTTSASKRRFHCPYPSILEIAVQHSSPSDDGDDEHDDGEDCNWAFGRLYDVERHLKSAHRCTVGRKELENWFDHAAGEA